MTTTQVEILTYRYGSSELAVRLQGDTVWLSQELMTVLFGRERSVITKHLRNVFAHLKERSS